MTWTHLGSTLTAVNNVGAPPNAVSGTYSSAVAVGDTILVSLRWDTAASLGVVTDSLGNTYHNSEPSPLLDAGDFMLLQGFWTISIAAGTPLITGTFNGNPSAMTLIADAFNGSNASSTIDGHSAQVQTGISTGTDNESSGAFTTTIDGALLWGVTVNSDTAVGFGSLTWTTGTGFTIGDNTPSIVVGSEWRMQTTAGTTAVTFNATNATAAKKMTLGFAISPAVVTATARQRRTLSALGTRVGSRGVQLS